MMHFLQTLKKTMKPNQLITALVVLFSLAAASNAMAAKPTIKFGVPSWPGVTVQSEVAAQLLDNMGFKVKQVNSSPAFIIKTMMSGDIDAYFGGWMPTEAGLINPPAKKGKVDIMATNISNALMGLAVPDYVWEAGVHSVADLHKVADKFDHTIYGIEAGSGFNKAINKAIDNNRHQLGDWKMLPSSTSAMLVQVKDAIQNKDWIVFLGWQPHWMNITYDIKYLTPEGEPTIAGTTSDVLTVANPDTVKAYPQLGKFLTQFVITKDTMSQWIYAYGYKKTKPAKAAHDWIANNMDKVAVWLDGVTTRDGKPAITVIKAAYKN